jgi:hypothetical protein
MAMNNDQHMEAESYARRNEAPPWFVDACHRHLGDLLAHHEIGHGEMILRPLWALKGPQHGTTKERGAYARQESRTKAG